MTSSVRSKKHSVLNPNTLSALRGVIGIALPFLIVTGNRECHLWAFFLFLFGAITDYWDGWLARQYQLESAFGKWVDPFTDKILILAPLVASLIHLAISRKREFLADASAVLLTRYPEGLVSALKKISIHGRPIRTATNATAHLFFENPFGTDADGDGIPDHKQKVSWISKIFSTHPPIQERIAALENLKV